MKKSLIKTEEFLIWRFRMDRGDVKRFNHEEVTRGLTDRGPFTVNQVNVFTRGSFLCTGDGTRLVIREGEGGFESVPGAVSLRGLQFESLEDGSEYYCINPRGEPKYWNREVHLLEKNKFALVPGGHYLFDSGKPALVRGSWAELTIYYAERDTIVARMWK